MKHKIVMIADTHSLHSGVKIPDGDFFLCAGDFTNVGEVSDISAFNKFMGKLPHKHKVLIAGNHDLSFEDERRSFAESMLTDCHYLFDSSVEIEGIKIYGTPWQPAFCNWAFNLPRGHKLKAKWDMIPDDTDILITHGPPLGIGDFVPRIAENVGCEHLLARVEEIKPKIHLFGHIHFGYGVYKREHTFYINASICTEGYDPIYKPIVVEYDTDTGSVDLVQKGNKTI